MSSLFAAGGSGGGGMSSSGIKKGTYTSSTPRQPTTTTTTSASRSNHHHSNSHHAAQSPQRMLSRDQQSEVQEAFELFDLDKDSRLDYHEFKVALRALGFDLKKAEVLKLMRERSNHQQSREETSGQLTIDLDNFSQVAEELILSRDPLDEIRRAFRLFDEENSGKISFRNLKKIARELGENLTDDELQAMIEEFDLDQDGEISEQEFIK
ncbi:centrin [Sporobolomyces koalae]|uniref:centrin n=1 Tax=Sporobolomyces koalae TaxID=500713 RepID=UPI003180D38C